MRPRMIAAALACAATITLSGCSLVPTSTTEVDDEQVFDDSTDSAPEEELIDDEAKFDGKYEGEFADPGEESNTGTVTFAVEGDTIVDFSAAPLAVCTNPSAVGGIEVIAVEVMIDEIDLSEDGRFRYSHTERVSDSVDIKQGYLVEGVLVDGEVRDGTIKLTRRCVATAGFEAIRM